MTRAVRTTERIRDKELAEMIGLPLARVREASAGAKIPSAALFGRTWTYNLRTIRFWIRKGRHKRILPPSTARQGIVYVVRCGAFVKIGFSKALKRRLPGIQTGSPERLIVLAEFPATTDHENALHQRFAPLRSQGDWFRLEGDVAAWVEAGCPL